MTLTEQQRKDRICIRSEKCKCVIKEKLQKECISKGITYNEDDTNAQLCEKLNS